MRINVEIRLQIWIMVMDQTQNFTEYSLFKVDMRLHLIKKYTHISTLLNQ